MPLKIKLQTFTVEEYLQTEQRSEVRHEYIAGQLYAMVGASKQHNLIAGGLYSILRGHLKLPCRAFISDVKVRIDDIFYYPDIVVSCTEGDPRAYYESSPILIIEVLSPATEAKDRFEKRVAYQRLTSLREYVLVAQDKMQVEVYRRTDDDWELEQYTDEDTVQLASVGLKIPITDVYRDVMGSV